MARGEWGGGRVESRKGRGMIDFSPHEAVLNPPPPFPVAAYD